MRFIFKLLFYTITLLLMIIFFLPKENIYYFGEKELKKYNIIISDEKVEDKGLEFNIKDSKLYFEQIKSVDIESLSILTTIGYNQLVIKNIIVDESLQNLVPSRLDSANIIYSILDPLVITIDGVGSFGKLKGVVYLIDRKIVLELLPSKLMKSKYKQHLSMMKKQSSGVYRYENSF